MKKTFRAIPFVRTAIPLALTAILLVSLSVMISSEENADITRGRSVQKPIPIADYTYAALSQEDAPAGVVEEYCFALDDTLEYDSFCSFYLCHQYARVYVNDVCVYSLEPSGDLPMVKTVGCNWVNFPLNSDDAGANVRVVITPVYRDVCGEPVEFLLAPMGTIVLDQFRSDVLPAAICVMLIVLGLMMLICAVCFMGQFHKVREIVAYSIMAICIGVWRGLALRSVPLLFPETALLAYYIATGAMMLGILPFVLSCRRHIGQRVTDCYLCIVAAVYCVIFILQFEGVADVREFLLLIQALIMAGFFLPLIAGIGRWRKSKTGFGVESVIALVLIVGAIPDYVLFYVKRDSFISSFFLFAQLIVIGINILVSMKRYSVQEQKLIRQENEILQNKIIMMSGQIRSHFMFNVLNSISGLCRTNPEQADRTIVCFARYLRANMEIMQEDQPIPFALVCRRLEDYWRLIQLRYGEDYRLVQQIETDAFRLPSMVLQPLIENAIVHGLRGKPGGGTVLLRTWTEGDHVMLSVQDDGVGFDPAVTAEGVGLQNVRFRLRCMVGGSLELCSAPGCGTTATIILSEARPG